MGRTIHITLNGMTEEVPEKATLSFLIKHFREEDPALIVEHNGLFVYPQEYDATTVSENRMNKFDPVEFIHPDFGG